MPYFLQDHVIYHIPKTGGCSIERLLRGQIIRDPRYDRHDPPCVVHAPDHLHSVAVIRHPVAWYRSWFDYINHRGAHTNPPATVWWYRNYGKELNKCIGMDFKDWVLNLPISLLYSIYDRYTDGCTVLKLEEIDQGLRDLGLLTIGRVPIENPTPGTRTQVPDDLANHILAREYMIMERWYS